MIGRRRKDQLLGELPDDLQRGDYWKYVDGDGAPINVVGYPSNLTGTAWGICAPMSGTEFGWALGRLMKHTVREHDDGRISVRPGDGSSNSILITGAHGCQWHGYIERGVWSEC